MLKNLKDYFSPPKVPLIVPEEDAKNSEKQSECIKELPAATNDKENTIIVVKRKRGRKKRKPSDPQVKNIAELLSSSLMIVSPNTSLDRTAANQNGSKNIASPKENGSHTLQEENRIPAEVSTPELLSPKVNVFHFMMNSRNKVIGRNSPGREESETSESPKEGSEDRKQKLSARKDLLKSWADAKGGAKRKRHEVEREKYVQHRLNKRTKRFKKLVQNLDAETKEEEEVVESSVIKVKMFSALKKRKSKSRLSLKKNGANKNVEVEENEETNIENGISVDIEKTDVVDEDKCENSIIEVEEIEEPKIVTEEIEEETTILKKKVKKFKTAKEEIKEKTKILKKKVKKLKRAKEETEDIKTVNEETGEIKIANEEIEENDQTETSRRRKRKRIIEEIAEVVETRRSQRVRKTTLDKSAYLEESDDDKKKKKKTPVDEIYEIEETKSKKKKVAPIFLKALPKPKEDPKIAAARKEFLLSGIPSNLKKAVEKQRSLEEREFNVFPEISHVQQKDAHEFWQLKKLELNLKYSNLPAFNVSDVDLMFKICTKLDLIEEKIVPKKPAKITSFIPILKQIKSTNEKYHVNKHFRKLKEKNFKQDKKKSPNKSKNAKRKSQEGEKICKIEPELWTVKYKPTSSDDILGNQASLLALKKWFESWLEFSEEMAASAGRKKKRGNGSSSESDFVTDSDSGRESSRLPGTTIILEGPTGSGKTSTVYAFCKQYNLNVLELNASSKRTGKRLLQELQEATQSHQVRKNAINGFLSKPKDDEEEKKKMCVVLIEDVDLVFEQDDGFIAALAQLIYSSKRPIILTTTDKSSGHVQKFTSQFKVLHFAPLTAQQVGIWLQLVCLVEGIYVNQSCVFKLLEYCGNDVRRTLNQLQYWTLSGGDFKAQVQTISNLDDSAQQVEVHRNCSETFHLTKNGLPVRLDLGLLWWNLPDLLPAEGKSSDLGKLVNLYDALSVCDISRRKNDAHNSEVEPHAPLSYATVKDSLEIAERFDEFNAGLDFYDEFSHFYMDAALGQFKKADERRFNMGLPSLEEKRLRKSRNACTKHMVENVSSCNFLDRKSQSLDYFPSLRNIIRSEDERALNNTKRGNRFRHYFRDAGLNFNEVHCKFASNILITEQD